MRLWLAIAVLFFATAVSAQNLSVPRRWPSATVFPSGEVLVCGGGGGAGSSRSCDRWIPWKHQWGAGPQLNVSHNSAGSALLADGTFVMVAGAPAGDGAERLRPGGTVWELLDGGFSQRGDLSTTLLRDGRVLA